MGKINIVLGLFLGGLGVHTFVAGRTAIGLVQLAVFVGSIPLMCFGVGFVTIFIPSIWALVDIIIVQEDGRGRRRAANHFRVGAPVARATPAQHRRAPRPGDSTHARTRLAGRRLRRQGHSSSADDVIRIPFINFPPAGARSGRAS